MHPPVPEPRQDSRVGVPYVVDAGVDLDPLPLARAYGCVGALTGGRALSGGAYGGVPCMTMPFSSSITSQEGRLLAHDRRIDPPTK